MAAFFENFIGTRESPTVERFTLSRQVSYPLIASAEGGDEAGKGSANLLASGDHTETSIEP